MNAKLSTSSENKMKTIRTVPWLAGAALACLFLAAPSAKAQTVSSAAVTVTNAPTTSTATSVIKWTATVPFLSTYIADPSGAIGTMVYWLDASKATGVDGAGKTYTATTCQHNVTRPVAPKDTLTLTCSAEASDGSHVSFQAVVNVVLNANNTLKSSAISFGSLSL
jgi:hypothetical protein